MAAGVVAGGVAGTDGDAAGVPVDADGAVGSLGKDGLWVPDGGVVPQPASSVAQQSPAIMKERIRPVCPLGSHTPLGDTGPARPRNRVYPWSGRPANRSTSTDFRSAGATTPPAPYRRPGPGVQKLIMWPAMPSTDSFRASDKVGCAWMLRPTSSAVRSHC